MLFSMNYDYVTLNLKDRMLNSYSYKNKHQGEIFSPTETTISDKCLQ